MKSPEPLTTEDEKKQIAEVDKALEQIGSGQKQADVSAASDDYDDGFDDDIVEELPVEEPDLNPESGAGGSQSMGLDPSVTSLDIEGYDYVGQVQLKD